MSKQTFRLTLRANKNAFEPEHLTAIAELAPDGHSHKGTVSATIIGYWIDLIDSNGSVLYRRFLNYLPHNLATTWQGWSTIKRKNARFHIDLPALEQAHELALYEQKYDSPEAKWPSRHCHFTFSLQHSHAKPEACNEPA